MTQAYPLSWPHGVERMKTRTSSQFKTALDPALTNVTTSLRRFGDATEKPVSNIVISSNFTLGERNPADPGVAVWFVWDNAERCIAVDRYQKLEHNLQAIHHVLEARVTEARHGGLRIVRQTFTGFLALPSPELAGGLTARQVLGLDGGGRRYTADEIRLAHRERAKRIHPDSGGSADEMAALNAARDAMLAELGA